jgi:hypothetical protein
MNQMRKEISMTLILAAVFIALVLIALTLARVKTSDRAGTYKQRALMTDNELEFFGRLVAALPDHYIFPQVAMSALLEASSSDKRMAHSDRLRIAQQRIDYVVCNKRCEVVAVVELDDRTHSRAKDKIRDSRLEQAAVKTVRFQSRQKPTADAIRAAVLAASTSAPASAPAMMAA